jgi:hypothetical protein
MVVDPAELMPEPTGFVAFRGEGNRCVVCVSELLTCISLYR